MNLDPLHIENAFWTQNAPAVFSRIVVKAFQEYIYKNMGVYFDD